jgi:hypothetical protein
MFRLAGLVQSGGKNSSIMSCDRNDSLVEKVDYIRQNPVRAGLVEVEGEYRWLWRSTIAIL